MHGDNTINGVTAYPVDNHYHCFCTETTGYNFQCCRCGKLLYEYFEYSIKPYYYYPYSLVFKQRIA